MATEYEIIDGDGHLVEDLDAIREFMPADFRPASDGPVSASLADLFPPKDHLHAAQAVRVLPGSFRVVGPKEWLEFADSVGISEAALYPTRALQYGFIVNRDWAIAVCRAYNDWLHDTYLRRSPRFIGMGLVPLQEPEAAVEELRRIVTELGMRGAVLPATGLPLPLGSRAYRPVFEEANRLGCCIAVHGGAHVRIGLDSMEAYAAVNALGHPFGQMISFASIVFAGLVDRCPGIRWAFLEAGISWLLVAMERFGRAYETHIPIDPRGEFLRLVEGETVTDKLKSYVAAGRIFLGCEGDEPFLADVTRAMGCNPAFFSSDFPHETNAERCRHEIEEVLEHPALAESDKKALLAGNSKRFYGLAGAAAG